MKIELKNLKIAASLSEETTAYTATIYVDGKPAFSASNHGFGGPDDYRPVNGYTGPSEREINEWLKVNIPPHGPNEADPAERAPYDNGLAIDLELYVGMLISKVEDEKQWARLLQKTSVLEDGKIMSWAKAKLPPTPQNLERVREAIASGKIKGELINGSTDEGLIARAKAAFGIKDELEENREGVYERLRENRLTSADARFIIAEDQRAEKPDSDLQEAMLAIAEEQEARYAAYQAERDAQRKTA